MPKRNAADDRRKAEEIDRAQPRRPMVYNVEKMLKEHRSKIERGGCEGCGGRSRGDQEGDPSGQSG